MRIGFGDSANGCRESKKGLIRIVNGGKIILKGTVGLSQGVVLLVNNSSLVLGDHFRCNYSTTIDCTDENIVSFTYSISGPCIVGLLNQTFDSNFSNLLLSLNMALYLFLCTFNLCLITSPQPQPPHSSAPHTPSYAASGRNPQSDRSVRSRLRCLGSFRCWRSRMLPGLPAV